MIVAFPFFSPVTFPASSTDATDASLLEKMTLPVNPPESFAFSIKEFLPGTFQQREVADFDKVIFFAAAYVDIFKDNIHSNASNISIFVDGFLRLVLFGSFISLLQKAH